jgi:hypothetical protein
LRAKKKGTAANGCARKALFQGSPARSPAKNKKSCSKQSGHAAAIFCDDSVFLTGQAPKGTLLTEFAVFITQACGFVK